MWPGARREWHFGSPEEPGLRGCRRRRRRCRGAPAGEGVYTHKEVVVGAHPAQSPPVARVCVERGGGAEAGARFVMRVAPGPTREPDSRREWRRDWGGSPAFSQNVAGS